MGYEKYIRDENMTTKNINKRIYHKALYKIHPGIMKMVILLWKVIKYFPSTKKRKESGVFKFLRFEKRIQKASLLWT